MSAAQPALVIISAVAADPILESLQRRYASRSCLLTNLCRAQVTVDVGNTTAADRLLIEGVSVDVNRIHGIVVSGVACQAPPGYSGEDSRYIELETFAIWIALLSKARCRVLNRPRFGALPPGLSPFQVRAAARQAGVPTVTDELCTGADLLKRQARGTRTACLDLVTQSAFWLGSCPVFDDGRLYSATALTFGEPQVLLTYVAGHCEGYVIFPHESHAASSDALLPATLGEATESAHHLVSILGLDYGFLSFRSAGKRLEFCRAYAHWPGGTLSPVAERTAAALADELGRS
jgi:hypothetical protein